MSLLFRRAFASAVKPAAAPTPLGMPLNLPKWLSENSHLLKPPINNYCVYDKHVTVMIVGGPNARTDYHVNQTAEWFYQYRGSMLLKTIDATAGAAAGEGARTSGGGPPNPAAFVDVPIREGEMFLLPPNVPHNPVRFADTVGIVIEQKRPADSVDALRWYCQACRHPVHEASFHCTDLGSQLKEAVRAFAADRRARTCPNCGTLCAMVHEGLKQP